MSSEAPRASESSTLRLIKVLTPWDLIFYGLVLIQPAAPIPMFGVAQKLSNGYFVTIILVPMFAMIITALSYGRMAAVYPSAGSAYTYVSKALNPHLVPMKIDSNPIGQNIFNQRIRATASWGMRTRFLSLSPLAMMRLPKSVR
jgi:amino acid transporter